MDAFRSRTGLLMQLVLQQRLTLHVENVQRWRSWVWPEEDALVVAVSPTQENVLGALAWAECGAAAHRLQ